MQARRGTIRLQLSNMHQDEGSGREEDRSNGRDQQGRSERIGVGGGDDAVTRIQLAARWSESYSPEAGDTLVGILKRFRMAYEYLDSVIHGVEPVEPDQYDARHASAAAAAPPPYAPPSQPPEAPPPPPAPEPERRPWG
jgi:hypothetical protein